MSPPLSPPRLPVVEDGLASGFLSDVVLPLSLAIIMIGLGLSLARSDFRRVSLEPRAVGAGLVAQLLVLPLMGVVVVVLLRGPLGLSDALVAGLILTTCLPGGATSNLLAYLARADAALSVTLTSLTSLASVITTPLAFLFATRLAGAQTGTINVSITEVGALVLVIVVIPVLIGMEIRRRWPAFATRVEPKLRAASAIFLGLIVLALIIENRTQFLDLAARTLPAALALNLLAIAGGLGVAHVAGVTGAQARTIAIEVAFQNGTLGIAIALSQLHSSEAAIFPAFYSLLMFGTGGILARIWSRTDPEPAENPTPA